MKPQPANGVRDEGAFPAGLNAPLITGVIPMDTLLGILRRGTMSGSVAGGAAALTAAVRAPLDCSTAYAPINAVTHCIWPRRAFAETGPSARFTLTGLAIHQASAIFWGLLFETCVERAAGLRDRVGERSTGMQAATAIAAAGATAAVAYAVDYHVVPERVTPGFDAHLSNRSMFCVYTALAAGFAAAALIRKD
jgi:hypothetical protein